MLGQGDTKSSVLLEGGFQADLRLVAAESRGAAMQYFTGSKAHNIALRDRAIGLGLKLNEYGLFRVDDDVKCRRRDARKTIYDALGLDWMPPELRENRGEIEAARRTPAPAYRACRPSRRPAHAHDRNRRPRDARDDGAGGAAAGLEYIAITDHSQALAMANGLDEARAGACRADPRDRRPNEGIRSRRHRMRHPAGRHAGSRRRLPRRARFRDRVGPFRVQPGTAANDRSAAARASRTRMSTPRSPDRPAVLKREPIRSTSRPIVGAAVRRGVALEINCQADRLDLNDSPRATGPRPRRQLCDFQRRAFADALERPALGHPGGATRVVDAGDVLNTRPFDDFRRLSNRR